MKFKLIFKFSIPRYIKYRKTKMEELELGQRSKNFEELATQI